MEVKQTALEGKHIALGAKMAAFAGYNMPISYTSIREEHINVRNHVSVFDVSHMGEFIVKGKEALEFLQSVTSNDVSVLNIGDAQYSCLPNDEGGIVDDLLIYRLDEDKCSDGERAYMLVVNAANIDKDWNWLEQKNNFEVRMSNISDHSSLIAVQGPKASDCLQSLTSVDLSAMKYYTFTKATLAGCDNVLISATGYTGSGGFELYAKNDQIAQIWDAVFESGKSMNIQAAGLGARDTLRLEMGYCLYGNDIDDSTSPLEAGLAWITKLDKGAFSSSQIFLDQKANGTTKRLVGFKVNDRRVPRKHYEIQNEAGEKIGEVTSGSLSPSLEYPIGMGYINKPHHKRGSTIYISTGKKRLEAEIIKLPFYKQA